MELARDIVRLGFVGLGEAAGAIAAGLSGSAARLYAFDARAGDATVRERAAAGGVTLVADPAELAARSDVVIGLTSGSSAVAVAEVLAGALRPGHVYADWNSASPDTKRRVAAAVEPSGARFADGAVMAAVPAHGHRVPVLLSGAGAEELRRRCAGLGMNLRVIGAEPGQAAAVKMLRSLIVKGLESLVVECTVAAGHYGVVDEVLRSLDGTPDTSDWRALSAYLHSRVREHGARRASELDEVARTVSAAGLEPWLAEAAARRMRWAAETS
ncbi:NAD(P)-dependent oxidoreductase [Jiangella sp. DSM 45060]|uniref:NAD(P)-dependent oxidoreductase n=1 Tax=Jiangella sp. DSM 45060 TaxID=1798224 RepID=UPI00087CDA46|nr:NAD(P)-dependent oxidoreductase [Jiangella sp. DSM 45060]SDT20242.1 3-hydroxyisobutyrate dehydrogenase [Jiangella sp. DSM 45060]